MTYEGRDSRQIKTIGRVYKIKQEKIKNNINQLNDAINKKKISVSRLQGYADSYAGKCDSLLLQNTQIIKNNEAFYQNLARVIHAEKSDLIKLNKIRDDLIGSYTGFSRKIDGLNQFCEEISREKLATFLKIQDGEICDLSITMACRKARNQE